MTSASTEGRRAITDADIAEILVRNVGAEPDLFEAGTAAGTLTDLGLDSLAFLELQSVVKERFAAEIPPDGLELSVAEIVAIVNKHLGG